MSYPTEETIRQTLRPYLIAIWTVTLVLAAGGLWLDVTGTMPNAFPRAGGVILIAVVYLYFYLENREFLTGNQGNYFDSDNHFLPKKVLGTSYFFVSLIGSLASIFGDLPVSLFKCGMLTCSS